MADEQEASDALRVLVVEDTPTVADLIRRALEAEGMGVEVVSSLSDARLRLAGRAPHVVVLDVELPDGSGFSLLRERRDGGAHRVPVVVLSSRFSEDDRVLGLELGAEDYVVKPFFPRELATRVRRAAERPAAGRPPRTARLDFGDLVIEGSSRQVLVHGNPIELTDREFELLAHLASSPGTVFSREDLLRDVWKSSSEWQTSKTVTEHVRRVRRKLGEDPAEPRWITTVGRVGYRFDPS